MPTRKTYTYEEDVNEDNVEDEYSRERRQKREKLPIEQVINQNSSHAKKIFLVNYTCVEKRSRKEVNKK